MSFGRLSGLWVVMRTRSGSPTSPTLRTSNCFVYLAFILDSYSWLIVGCQADPIVGMVSDAHRRRASRRTRSSSRPAMSDRVIRPRGGRDPHASGRPQASAIALLGKATSQTRP
jgi:hypothetical protein